MGMILGLLLILLVLGLFLLHVWLSMRKSSYMGLLFPFIVGLAAIYRYVGTVYPLYLNLRGYHLWKPAMIWYELQGELTSAVGLIPVGRFFACSLFDLPLLAEKHRENRLF